MELERATNISNNLIKALGSGCDRIGIAGSVRRGKPEVKDIELIAIPKIGAPRPMFGEKVTYKNRLEQILDGLRRSGMIDPVKGGDKYKQFWLLEDRVHLIKMDLFLVTPPAQWGVQMVIRTGPAEFSAWMVTQKNKGGALPNGYHVEGGCVRANEQDDYIISMPEEENYFSFCGIDWIEPRERKAAWAPLSLRDIPPNASHLGGVEVKNG